MIVNKALDNRDGNEVEADKSPFQGVDDTEFCIVHGLTKKLKGGVCQCRVKENLV